jgi:erythritol transport system ATP-binding protein
VTKSEVCVFEARDVTKVFPGTTALRNVSVRLRAGDVHALIGENGAGKSTLVQILAGIEQPTAGTLLLEGHEVRFGSVREAAARGIGLIHQELQLFPDLSVAENLFVGRERSTAWGAIDTAAQERDARAVLARLGQPIDPRALVGSLPLGLQQIVEIARALVAETRILMMDEPTSALTPTEVNALFAVIRDLAARGVAIVYISHHLHELLAIADRVSVLRDGAVVGEAATREIDVPWIVERMAGHRPEIRTRRTTTPGPTVLEVRDLSLGPAPGRTALDRVSLQLRAGEVLGVYGLLGSGRTELFESLLGIHAGATGEVTLDGHRLTGADVSRRVEAGLAMVPEDRQAAGLVSSFSVQQNMTLSSLAAFTSGGVLRPEAERQASAALVQALRVKTAGLDAPVTSLSGGNQQKVVIARGVMPRPRVLLLDDPTRGVDVAAKAEILGTMRMLAGQGMAVAFASSDLAEILDGADRVIVMARGRVNAEFSEAEATEPRLVAAASAEPGSGDGAGNAVH